MENGKPVRSLCDCRAGCDFPFGASVVNAEADSFNEAFVYSIFASASRPVIPGRTPSASAAGETAFTVALSMSS